MSLSANNTDTQDSTAGALNSEVVSAAEIYAGAYVGLNTYTHGTAASQGRLVPFNDANFIQPVGFSLGRATGAASGAVEQTFTAQSQVRRVAVTGVSAQAQVGRKVYATDDNTYTLTRPTLGAPIGVVIDWVTSTTCDVLFFSTEALFLLAMSGWGQYTMTIGVVNGLESAGNHATGIPMAHHGLILSTWGTVFEPITDADATATVNLEIDATDVTGGVITWATADVLGDRKDGTAVTAANEFHEGSALDMEVAAGTAGTATDGYLLVQAEIELLPGL